MSAERAVETDAVGRRYSGSGNPTHGIASTYRSQVYACRCQPCCDASSALQAREDSLRRARLEQDVDIVAHGLASTYINWKCRCDSCKAAHSAELRRKRLRRIARLKADPSIVEHGRAATYNGWGCRCDECVTASAADRRRRYRAGQQADS